VIRVRVKATPKSIDGLGSPGGKETAAAIAFFGVASNTSKSYEFTAYKAQDISDTLMAEFSGKCAYCEVAYEAGHPVDIEHFRPKGGVVVDGKLSKPGYYWLAADWMNLLPSCIDCNRRRYQKVEGLPKALAGKANLFPVVDETHRATTPGQEANEPRLLLHPRLDDPRKHLEFLPKGGIRARQTGAGPSPMGEHSIVVYGLRRSGLARRRADRQKLIDGSLVKVQVIRAELASKPNDAFATRMLELELATLREFVAGSAEYSAMARQVIGPIPKV